MQFLMYSLDDPTKATPPTPEMFAQLDQLTKDAIAAGVLVTTGGVGNTGLRVRQTNGQATVTDGPFIEAKELMGGFAVFNVATVEDAIAWAKRFRSIIGDGESEIVRIYGPSDNAG
jgi:hypothetical protein